MVIIVHFKVETASDISKRFTVQSFDSKNKNGVNFLFFFYFFLVGYVEERLWWPIKSPNIGGKKKASS